jgi:putative hydrolase of HD superfamily
MLTKAPFPADHLPDRGILPIVESYFQLVQLKQLYRQGWLRRGISPERCESVAEHAFGVAVLAMLLVADQPSTLDPLKVLQMALLHDVGEVHAGDLVPADEVSPEEKHRREQQSVLQVLSGLPGAEDHLALWQEYEDGSSAESRFVREVDRLEMALQAAVYEYQCQLDLSDFFRSADCGISHPALRLVLDALRSVRRGSQGGSDLPLDTQSTR